MPEPPAFRSLDEVPARLVRTDVESVLGEFNDDEFETLKENESHDYVFREKFLQLLSTKSSYNIQKRVLATTVDAAISRALEDAEMSLVTSYRELARRVKKKYTKYVVLKTGRVGSRVASKESTSASSSSSKPSVDHEEQIEKDANQWLLNLQQDPGLHADIISLLMEHTPKSDPKLANKKRVYVQREAFFWPAIVRACSITTTPVDTAAVAKAFQPAATMTKLNNRVPSAQMGRRGTRSVGTRPNSANKTGARSSVESMVASSYEKGNSDERDIVLDYSHAGFWENNEQEQMKVSFKKIATMVEELDRVLNAYQAAGITEEYNCRGKQMLVLTSIPQMIKQGVVTEETVITEQKKREKEFAKLMERQEAISTTDGGSGNSRCSSSSSAGVENKGNAVDTASICDTHSIISKESDPTQTDTEMKLSDVENATPTDSETGAPVPAATAQEILTKKSAERQAEVQRQVQLARGRVRAKYFFQAKENLDMVRFLTLVKTCSAMWYLFKTADFMRSVQDYVRDFNAVAKEIAEEKYKLVSRDGQLLHARQRPGEFSINNMVEVIPWDRSPVELMKELRTAILEFKPALVNPDRRPEWIKTKFAVSDCVREIASNDGGPSTVGLNFLRATIKRRVAARSEKSSSDSLKEGGEGGTNADHKDGESHINAKSSSETKKADSDTKLDDSIKTLDTNDTRPESSASSSSSSLPVKKDTLQEKRMWDFAYYLESDQMIALLALGACEDSETDARGRIKKWFESRFSMGSKANGADHTTFIYAKAASLFRLYYLGMFLNEHVYEKEQLADSLGQLTSGWKAGGSHGDLLEGRYVRFDMLGELLDDMDASASKADITMSPPKIERPLLSIDNNENDPLVAPRLPADNPLGGHFLQWATAHFKNKMHGMVLSGDTVELLFAHLLVMVGTALDPFYSSMMQSLFTRVASPFQADGQADFHILEEKIRYDMLTEPTATGLHFAYARGETFASKKPVRSMKSDMFGNYACSDLIVNFSAHVRKKEEGNSNRSANMSATRSTATSSSFKKGTRGGEVSKPSSKTAAGTAVATQGAAAALDQTIEAETTAKASEYHKIFLQRRCKAAPVKKVERMMNKVDLDYKAEPTPKSASNCDVIRCGVTAATVEQLRRDMEVLCGKKPAQGYLIEEVPTSPEGQTGESKDPLSRRPSESTTGQRVISGKSITVDSAVTLGGSGLSTVEDHAKRVQSMKDPIGSVLSSVIADKMKAKASKFRSIDTTTNRTSAVDDKSDNSTELSTGKKADSRAIHNTDSSASTSKSGNTPRNPADSRTDSKESKVSSTSGKTDGTASASKLPATGNSKSRRGVEAVAKARLRDTRQAFGLDKNPLAAERVHSSSPSNVGPRGTASTLRMDTHSKSNSKTSFVSLHAYENKTFRVTRCPIRNLCKVLRLMKTKNGWVDDEKHRESRAEKYHYASLMLIFVYSPHVFYNNKDVISLRPMTFGDLAKNAKPLWNAYVTKQDTWNRTLSQVAYEYLTHECVQNKAVEYLSEVQLQYEPYVTYGRLKTHLHYKFVRATDAHALMDDFSLGSKYVDQQHSKDFQDQYDSYVRKITNTWIPRELDGNDNNYCFGIDLDNCDQNAKVNSSPQMKGKINVAPHEQHPGGSQATTQTSSCTKTSSSKMDSSRKTDSSATGKPSEKSAVTTESRASEAVPPAVSVAGEGNAVATIDGQEVKRGHPEIERGRQTFLANILKVEKVLANAGISKAHFQSLLSEMEELKTELEKDVPDFHSLAPKMEAMRTGIGETIDHIMRERQELVQTKITKDGQTIGSASKDPNRMSGSAGISEEKKKQAEAMAKDILGEKRISNVDPCQREERETRT